ncbi:MAG: hypothetical protein KC478_07145 [Bacteriovoracaceae bacterium]|nr:hypothetical protein [Bacteriovoracaceae bacterium]
MENYRDAVSGSEIANILEASRESEDNIIWQNVEDTRNVFKVLDLEFDQKSLKIQVEQIPTFYPRLDHPIYCKLSHKESVFKSEILELGEYALQVKLPESIKAMELRAGTRLKFSQKDKKQVKLVVGGHKTARTSLRAQAIDISSTGAGLQVELDEAALEFVGKELLITALGTKTLDEPIICKLMYSRKYKCVLKNEIAERARLGLSFNRALTKAEMQEFLKS